MPEHAEISPSTYEYRELCNCWSQDPNGETIMAERGTSIHKATEIESTAGLTEPSDIDCANLCIKYIRYLKKKMRGPFVEFRELEVVVFDQWGYVDDLLIAEVGGEAHLTDFKSGYHGVTDAKDNAQMQGYARGVFYNYPKIQTLHVHLLLPRRQEISSHTYTRDQDYETISNRIFNIIEGAKRKDRYNPGWRQCEHCGNKADCPALMGMGLALAPRYKPDLVMPDIMDPAELKDGYRINLGLKLAKILEGWTEAMKTRAREWCSEGYALDDFKISEVKGSRSITDSNAAWKVTEDYGVTLEEYLNCCSATLGQVTDLIGEKAAKGTKGKTKLEFEDKLMDADCLTIGAPKQTLRAKTKELTL